MKNLKKNKGITLIALVITIIVMLILVAVTINIAVNGGLFGYAGNAVKETELAKQKEIGLADLEGGLSTDQLIEKFTTVPDIHSWTRGTTEATKDTFTCSHCGASYTIGDVVNYTPNTTKESVTILGTESGKGEGDANNQEISRPNDLSTLTWKVLGLDKNGSLLITTSAPIGSLYLKGAKGYLNGPTIMNTICEELFSSSQYGKARSINIDDVNNCFNFRPAGGMYYSKSQAKNVVTEGFNTTIEDVKEDLNFSITDSAKNNTPETNKSLGDYKINGYFYDFNGTDINMAGSKVGDATSVEKSVILQGNYWLASSGVRVDSGNAAFGPGIVHTVVGERVFSFCGLFNSNGIVGFNSFGVRPVVSLKSDLPTKVNS